MLSSPIEIVAALWGVVVILYLALFLFRSVIGMKEEDTLYLSVGEERHGSRAAGNHEAHQ